MMLGGLGVLRVLSVLRVGREGLQGLKEWRHRDEGLEQRPKVPRLQLARVEIRKVREARLDSCRSSGVKRPF